MASLKTLLPRIALLAALATLVVVGIASGGNGEEQSEAPTNSTARTAHLVFHEDAGVRNERILNLGGLVVRASCTNYGSGKIYLGVAAKTKVENAARAVVLSQQRGGKAQTYAFKSADFDRSYGWYDITGTDPHDTTGTLSFARPDGGQVAMTFEADQHTPEGDCTFDGTAQYLP